MRNLIISSTAAMAVAALMAAPAAAHHSFAMYNQSETILVEGTVNDWKYNNPHNWLVIDGVDENGAAQTWAFEGASPVHAARQGVTGLTFVKGEFVRVVMCPLRDGRPAGAMAFVIKEDGSIVEPNDGSCQAKPAIAAWQDNGWLDEAQNLDRHQMP